MNADQVRALVAAKWPEAMKSPLAVACATFAANDEADCVVQFASLQARATLASEPKACGDGCNGCSFCRRDTDQPTERTKLRGEAMDAAEACLNACGGWTVETLSHNIESAMGGELEADECDDIAREALRRRG